MARKKSSDGNLTIKKLKISDLKPARYNPRKDLKPGDVEYEQIRRSITEFGYIDPIIVNERNGVVIGGHQRLKILKDLGIKEADVSLVKLDDKKEKALNIALNKITGAWDDAALKDLLDELNASGADMDLTGFAPQELKDLGVYEPDEIVEDDFDVAAAAEAIKTPITRMGDVWQLGKHRLLCGDCTVKNTVTELFAGEKATMVFTDPPYNVNYGQTMKDALRLKNSPKYKGAHKASAKNAGRKILNDNFKDNKQFYQFLYGFIDAVRPWVLGDCYICMSSSELHTLQKAFVDCGGNWSTFIIWVKSHFTLGRSNYQRQYEPILYGWFAGSSHYWSGARNLGDVYKDQLKTEEDGTTWIKMNAGVEMDIWEFPKNAKNEYHPTQKPILLCARGIQNSSRPGDIVYDGFVGGGLYPGCLRTNQKNGILSGIRSY